MQTRHPKTVRRTLLRFLYDRYLTDPLDMPTPEDFLDGGAVTREELLPNAFYLYDRGLVELMMGYNPPMFAAARITAKGIDLVENTFEFDLQFPPEVGELEATLAAVPTLLERLTDEADFSPLDGDRRKCLQRDIQYLRDELARPAERWRKDVISTMLGWMERYFGDEAGEVLPSLAPLRTALDEKLRD